MFQPFLCLYHYFVLQKDNDVDVVFVRVPTKMKVTPPFHILWKYSWENRFAVLFMTYLNNSEEACVDDYFSRQSGGDLWCQTSGGLTRTRCVSQLTVQLSWESLLQA